MWGHVILETYNLSTFNTRFLSDYSDINIHLLKWQYWWWFWFFYFFIFYYILINKFLGYRSIKFRPKLTTSMKPHGRWGDLIIGILPIYWCLNILINSNFLLKLTEWQAETSFLTIRVRGKQWYWVYKVDLIEDIKYNNFNYNIGHNNIIRQNTNIIYSKKKFNELSLLWSNRFNKTNVVNKNQNNYLDIFKKYYLNNNNTHKSAYSNFSKNNGFGFLIKKPVNTVTYYNLPDKLVIDAISSNYIPKNNFNNYLMVNSQINKNIFVSGVYKINLPINNEYLFYKNNRNNNTLFLNKNNTPTKLGCSKLLHFRFNDKLSPKKYRRYYLTLRQKRLNKWDNNILEQQFFQKKLSVNHNQFTNNSILTNISKNPLLFNNSRLLNVNIPLVLPVQLNITIITNSFDVIHSWFIPGLGLKLDCVPGRSTHHSLFINVPGIYYGQCAEICGRFHHHMPIRVVGMQFEHFLLWWYQFTNKLNITENQDNINNINNNTIITK